MMSTSGLPFNLALALFSLLFFSVMIISLCISFKRTRASHPTPPDPFQPLYRRTAETTRERRKRTRGPYLLLLLLLFAEVAAVRIVLDDILAHVVHAVHQQLKALFQVVTMATD